MIFRRAVIGVLFVTTSACAHRTDPDQQIGLITECEQGYREAKAMDEAQHDEAVSRWAGAVSMAGSLCLGNVTDALVGEDVASQRLAHDVIVRTSTLPYLSWLVPYLDPQHFDASQRARVVAALRAISGRDFGDDRAAWERYRRSRE